MARGRLSVARRTVIATAWVAVAPGVRAQQPDYTAVDSVVWADLRAARLPGAALVIVRGDRVVHVRGFGVADASGRPVTPDTPFYLGSTTKSFTALAVLQLAHEGRLDLDAPVQRYLPWFSLADSAASRAVTARGLLVHRSGIPGRAGERFLSDDDTSAAAAERHVRWLAGVRPVDGFAYSNLNFTTLGLIVEAVSGMPFATYLHTRVFTPLGMQHTHTEPARGRRDGLAAGHSVVVGGLVDATAPANRGDLAAGYLMASAADVGRFLLAQVNGGRTPGSTGVAPAVVEAMHHSEGPIVPGRDITLGFSATTLDGVPILDIAGSLPGYASRFVIAPDSGWAVGLVANGNGVVAGEHVMGAALNAARMTMGRAAEPISLPPIVPVLIGAILVLPVLQVGWAAWLWRRWRRAPERRPIGWRGLLPVLGGAAWGTLVWAGFPVVFQTYWPTMLVFQPDIAWALLLSGGVALVWAATRAALRPSVRAAPRQSSPAPPPLSA